MAGSTRFTFRYIELVAAIRETAGEGDQKHWTIDLVHSPIHGGGPETKLCTCDERELRELAEVLDEPSRRGLRFQAFGGMREHIFDREEPTLSRFTLTDRGTPGRNEIDRWELKTFVWKVGSFIEARRVGMDLDLWCERVDEEMSRRKGELEMNFAREIEQDEASHHRRWRRMR